MCPVNIVRCQSHPIGFPTFTSLIISFAVLLSHAGKCANKDIWCWFRRGKFKSWYRSVSLREPVLQALKRRLLHTSTGKRQNTVHKINLRGEIGTLKHVHYLDGIEAPFEGNGRGHGANRSGNIERIRSRWATTRSGKMVIFYLN